MQKLHKFRPKGKTQRVCPAVSFTGIGSMAGGVGSFLINKGSGMFFTWADGQGGAFQMFGFEGKPAAYMVVFCICAVAYLVGWCIMKALVPKYKPIVVEN